MTDVMTTDVMVKAVESAGLTRERCQALIDRFAPMYDEVEALVKESAAIEVTDATQVTEMKAAYKLRRQIADARVAAEKVRKEEKAAYLLMGKAIDGMNRQIVELAEPVEARLLEMEKFAERAEATRKEEKRRARAAALHPYGVDTSAFDLGGMPDGAWAQLLDGSRLAWEKKKADEAAAAEAEKKRREEEAAERKRLAQENARLAAENAAKDAAARAERERVDAERRAAEQQARSEREAIEAKARAEREAAQAKLAAERAERERLEAVEAARVKAEAKAKADAEKAARKAANAPDAAKLQALAAAFAAVPLPAMATLEGQHELAGIKTLVAALCDSIRTRAGRLGGEG